MRPRDIDGVPDPALRRYLNPLAYATARGTPQQQQQQQVYGSGASGHGCSVWSAEFRSGVRRALAQETGGAGGESEVDDFGAPLAPMIQMQTYGRKKRRAGRAGAEASALVGERLAKGVRQREPRENSDFLRVIVLEMNMRRTGKLDAKAGGRARVWLPPRRQEGCAEVGERGKVPVRWVGVSVEY